MPRMSKKRKQEWALFLNDQNRITYNELCRKCRNDCKQSFRCIVVHCPKYLSKRRTKKNENEMNVSVPLEVVKASESEPKEVKWLWYSYIPFGKVTLLQGDPGDGKSIWNGAKARFRWNCFVPVRTIRQSFQTTINLK